MGMFDNIHVKENKINLPLPKGGYYQTKWLDSNLCQIQMDEEGRMTCPDFQGCQHYPVKDVEELHYGGYSGEFHFHGEDVNGKWHEFEAEVDRSRIIKLWSYGDLLFDGTAVAEDPEFEALPENWNSIAARVESVTLVRWKRRKGGQMAVRSYRTVKCNAPVRPDDDGLFKIQIDNPRIKATLYGCLKDNTINMQTAEVDEVYMPYLKKGFNSIVGYNLNVVASVA